MAKARALPLDCTQGARGNAVAANGSGKEAARGAARPPEVASAAEAVGRDAFLLSAPLVDAWFEQRSDVLLVTFDNLASVGQYSPPQPWLHRRAEVAGLSILGLIARRKDWYRNADTPALLGALRDAGLFRPFRRVVFAGASMGGYAALAYSALVPGSVVLAFSPQTSLSPEVVPFERRFPYGARRWDWSDPAFLDAAEVAASEVWLAYDPFVPEDRAHALRVMGPGVRHLRLGHLGHRAIRQINALGLLDGMIRDLAEGRFDGAAFARAFRARRGLPGWQRALLAEAERRGHPRLALAAAEAIRRADPEARFARRAARRLRAGLPDSGAGGGATGKAAGGTPIPFTTIPASPAPHATETVLPGIAPGPFRHVIAHLRDALVIPERPFDQRLASGVLDRDGQPVELARGWIRARKSTPYPTLFPDEPVADLPGRHLFAGHFRGHFGHFLVESTARLWALDHLGQSPDSLLYLPYRGEVGPAERAISAHGDFLRLLGIATPARTHPTALRVERLDVPELGFGWGPRYAGSPAYHAFVQNRLAHVRPEGPPRLYVSRARLAAARGGILGEAVIEANLARAGFEVFHPERNPVAVQVARYKAARTIVALDGSALHLAGFVFPPGGRVAIVLRRSKANVADYVQQYQGFCGVTPDTIDAIRTDWVRPGTGRVDYASVGELDFAALFGRLAALGHLPPGFVPDLPSATEMQALREAAGDLVPLPRAPA